MLRLYCADDVASTAAAAAAAAAAAQLLLLLLQKMAMVSLRLCGSVGHDDGPWCMMRRPKP